jgi:hypothetical protein
MPLAGVNGDRLNWRSQVHWFSPLTGVWFNGLQWLLAFACSFYAIRAGLWLAFRVAGWVARKAGSGSGGLIK